jgi:hypothetical protein
VSLTRLGNVKPGSLGIFSGSLQAQPASVQREVAAEMEQLGYGTLWYGESTAREAFAQAAIFLSATPRLVMASGIANIWARDPMAMAAGGRAIAEAWPDRFILGLGVSHAPMVAARGHDYGRPVSAMREYLDRMGQAAWRGPASPLPPIILAALGPRMVALALRAPTRTSPPLSTSGRFVISSVTSHSWRPTCRWCWPADAPRRERQVTGTPVFTSAPRTTETICSGWVGSPMSSSRQGQTSYSTPLWHGATSRQFERGLALWSAPAQTRSSST